MYEEIQPHGNNPPDKTTYTPNEAYAVTNRTFDHLDYEVVEDRKTKFALTTCVAYEDHRIK